MATKKIDFTGLTFLAIALILFIISLFLPWTIETSINGDIKYISGSSDGGVTPIFFIIITLFIYHLNKTGQYFTNKNSIYAVIIIIALFLITSFYGVIFHLDLYSSSTFFDDLFEYSHGIGFYIGLIALASQIIGSIIMIKIINDNITRYLQYSNKNQQIQYKNHINVKCKNCRKIFHINISNREPKCPYCQKRYNRCGYCGYLNSIRSVRCSSCNRHNMFRLFEIILASIFITASIFSFVILIFYQNIIIGLGALLLFGIGYLLFIAFPIRPWWVYFDEGI
jgi:hypothetical protein